MSILPGPLVEPAWLAEHLDDVALVDIRWYLDGRSGRAAYDEGHLPGAVFVDLDADASAPPAQPGGRHPLPHPDDFASAMSRAGIGDDTAVVVYDDQGGIVAGRLWWMLDSLGAAAAVLDGGFPAWEGPLESSVPEVEPALFTARPWPADRYASADDVASRADDVVVLDARSAERYAGAENPIDPRFGHIPGAHSAPATENLLPGGRFAAPDRLAERYRALGVEADTEVIAYCGSGVSANTDLLALRLIGNANARLYVGSWSEWGADDTRPIA